MKRSYLFLFLAITVASCHNNQGSSATNATTTAIPPPAEEEPSNRDKQHIVAELSQQMANYYAHDETVSAESMIPVHEIGEHEYLVNGIYMSNKGTGRYVNYTCKLKLLPGGRFRRGTDWECESLYTEGTKLK